jgi:hypothetical protein
MRDPNETVKAVNFVQGYMVDVSNPRRFDIGDAKTANRIKNEVEKAEPNQYAMSVAKNGDLIVKSKDPYHEEQNIASITLKSIPKTPAEYTQAAGFVQDYMDNVSTRRIFKIGKQNTAEKLRARVDDLEPGQYSMRVTNNGDLLVQNKDPYHEGKKKPAAKGLQPALVQQTKMSKAAEELLARSEAAKKAADEIVAKVKDNPKPVVVKIGNAARAEETARKLDQNSPDKYCTTVTDKGDLRVLNIDAAAKSVREAALRNFQHEKEYQVSLINVGDKKETEKVMERVNLSGYFAAMISDSGLLRVHIIEAYADSLLPKVGPGLGTSNTSTLESPALAKSVAKSINNRYENKYAAYADGKSVTLLDIKLKADSAFRSLGKDKTIKVEVGDEVAAGIIANRINKEHKDVDAVANLDGSLRLRRKTSE